MRKVGCNPNKCFPNISKEANTFEFYIDEFSHLSHVWKKETNAPSIHDLITSLKARLIHGKCGIYAWQLWSHYGTLTTAVNGGPYLI